MFILINAPLLVTYLLKGLTQPRRQGLNKSFPFPSVPASLWLMSVPRACDLRSEPNPPPRKGEVLYVASSITSADTTWLLLEHRNEKGEVVITTAKVISTQAIVETPNADDSSPTRDHEKTPTRVPLQKATER